MCSGVPGCFGALRARFQAGSFTTDGTIREFGVYRGWFGVYGVNLPRWRSISWKVRGPGSEPSAVEVDITEGADTRG